VRTRRVSPLARSRPRTRSSRGKRVGTGDFADAADGQADRCAGDCGGDVIGRHRLDRCGRDPHGVVVGCRVRDALDELVELRRVNDREGDAGFLDQLFLYLLGAEVPTGEQSVGADHGECDVVVHAGLLRRGEQVARGGGEEVPCGSILERRGVRDVDHHAGAGQHLVQTAPVSTSGRPSPAAVFTPVEGAAATAS
jgi:hypothetical protein